MHAHHQVLGEQLAGRADALSDAAAGGRPHGVSLAGFIACLAEEVLPHAAVEGKVIYPVARRMPAWPVWLTR